MRVAGEKTLIVGGGVIGAMSALYLARSGHKVTMVDQAKFGSKCSHANCGYVCPSHVLPLTTPGAYKDALKAVFSSQSALKIHPRLDFRFLRWMGNFARRCNESHMMESARALHLLLQSSMREFQNLVSENAIDCQWKELGLLFVYHSTEAFEAYRKVNDRLVQDFGIGAKPIDSIDLQQLEPALKPGLGGAWHYQGDRHLRPDLLMSSLKATLKELGVEVLEDTEVDEVKIENGQAIAVRSKDTVLEADRFVFATGAWTPLLDRRMGIRIPIEPGKGYSITTTVPECSPKIPMILEEHHVAVTPMDDCFRIGSTMEFAGYDQSMNEKRLDFIRSGARQYLHQPYTDQVIETWYGWRPMTWDGKPFIDRAPAARNLWVAAGHNMLGLSTCTATGKLLSELINDEVPHINPRPFGFDRLKKW